MIVTQRMINFPLILTDIAFKIIQLAFIPNRKLCGQMKTELRAKKSWRIFCNVMWKNELVGIVLPTIVTAAIKMYGDFLNFGQLSHSYINPKPAETFENWIINIV